MSNLTLSDIIESQQPDNEIYRLKYAARRAGCEANAAHTSTYVHFKTGAYVLYYCDVCMQARTVLPNEYGAVVLPDGIDLLEAEPYDLMYGGYPVWAIKVVKHSLSGGMWVLVNPNGLSKVMCGEDFDEVWVPADRVREREQEEQ